MAVYRRPQSWVILFVKKRENINIFTYIVCLLKNKTSKLCLQIIVKLLQFFE